MTKTKNLTKFLFLVLALTMLLSIPMLSMPKTAKAEEAISAQSTEIVTATTSTGLDVSVMSRLGDHGKLDPASTTTLPFNSVSCQTFLWQNAQHFSLKAVADQISATKVNDKYNYTLSLGYWEAKSSAAALQGLNPDELETIASGSVDDLAEITADYYIDTTENQTSFNHGWGMYRFRLAITTADPIYSNFFYIEPSTITSADEDVQISVRKYLPDNSPSLLDAYEFTITNTTDAYKYMDQSCIRWYAYGTSRDGTKYCYHVDDVGTAAFPSSEYSTEHTITQADQSRVKGSKVFRFETGTIAGDWKVYCEIYNQTPGRTDVDSLTVVKTTKDNPIDAPNGNAIQPNTVVWIIVAVAIVLVIGLVLIIIRAIRKEKVW